MQFTDEPESYNKEDQDEINRGILLSMNSNFNRDRSKKALTIPLLNRKVSSIKNDFSFDSTPTTTDTATTPTPASSLGFTDQEHHFINELLAHHSNTRTFNVVLIILAFIFYIIVEFCVEFRNDFHYEVDKVVQGANYQIENCHHNYVINKCEPDTRAPYLEKSCVMWDKCRIMDPYKTIRKTEIFSTIAGRIISSFVHQLSNRAMAFVFLVIIISISLLKR
ncbi:5838_t:CDS:2 [Entrophospora sp. SA101]|nr:5838_t:CDS:2 [Entrophospora sp. SA101]